MSEKWIVPCNINFFNVVDYLKEHNTVVWKMPASVCVGDMVYIYLGRPDSEIRYKCIVINDKLDKDVLQKNSYAIRERNPHNCYMTKEKYIEMELKVEYPKKTFSLEELRKQGLGQVQIPARGNRKIVNYIESIEAYLR